LLLGCAHTVKKPVPLATLAAPLPDADYRIQAGDKLDIKYLYSPELDESVTVRPDGLISIPLAHDVRAAGRTPAELTAGLRASLSRELRDPQITVIVRTFSSQVVYVSGEVGKPALLELRGGLTALRAIAQAGGFRASGRKQDVVLIRQGPNGEPLATTLHLADALNGTKPEADVLLRPQDILHVPERKIVRLNRWVKEYIEEMIPGRVGLSFSYRLNDDKNDDDDDEERDEGASIEASR
jgi:protein involved in polysaccharide export with SLBB domain